jgi:hypothetical protein
MVYWGRFFRLGSKDKNPKYQFEVISNLNWTLLDIQKIFFPRAYKMCLKDWGPFWKKND